MAKEKEKDKVSKMDAVRRTLAAGIETPAEAVEHIKKEFGMEISTNMFGNYKSTIKKAAAGPTTEEGKSKTTRKKKARSKTPEPSDAVQVAKSVKSLVDQVGADTFVEMAQLFRS